MPEASARRALPVLAVGLFLAVYGNAVSTVMAFPTPLGPGTGLVVGLLLMLISLAWARRAGLTNHEIGFGPGSAVTSGLVGLVAAAVLVTPAVLFLRFPPLLGAPVTYGPAQGIDDVALAQRVLFFMPLDTAVPEEIAFRGVLLGALLRQYSATVAVALAALPFTVWHVVIVGRTLDLTNLAEQPILAILGYLGALGAVFIGGVIFAWLRLATGNLAASITAHWGFNTALLVSLRVLQTSTA